MRSVDLLRTWTWRQTWLNREGARLQLEWNFAVVVVVGAYGALGRQRQATAKATSWLGELGLQRQWLAAAATFTTCGYCGMGENNGVLD